MALEIEYTCPLGSECETIKDNKIYRCAWYTHVVGKHPQTGEETNDWSCAIAWMPTLQIEQARTNRGQTDALESFRNEAVKGQNEFNKLIQESVQQRQNNLLGD